MKIAVIDTGLGGINLLNKLINKFPNNEYIYFCDNLNCPYGVKESNIVKKYIINILTYLEKNNINLLIVACNTISTFIDDLRKDFSFPIYTILDYNAKLLNQKYQFKKVTIIATSLTIRSDAYLYKTNNVEIQFVNGSYLTKLIEENNEIEIEKEINSLIKQCNKDSEAVLLGCTHYALYLNTFIKQCHKKIFIEGTKELINNLPLNNFKSPFNLKVLLTDYNENYLLKINKFLKAKYSIHKVNI